MTDSKSETSWLTKGPTIVGFVVTGIWFIIFIVVLWTKWSDIWSMKPNESGDFLAGWFAPPAFLWLIVGYMLQSRELTLQVRELAHHVKATQGLVTAAKDEAIHQRKQAQPVFHLRLKERERIAGTITVEHPFVFLIQNVSKNVAINVTWSVEEGSLELASDSHTIFAPGIDAHGPTILKKEPGVIRLDYMDSLGELQTLLYDFDGSKAPTVRKDITAPLTTTELNNS